MEYKQKIKKAGKLSYSSRLPKYEAEKNSLRMLDLSSSEYEQRVRKIALKYGI